MFMDGWSGVFFFGVIVCVIFVLCQVFAVDLT